MRNFAGGGIHAAVLFLITVVTYLMAYFMNQYVSYKKGILTASERSGVDMQR